MDVKPDKINLSQVINKNTNKDETKIFLSSTNIDLISVYKSNIYSHKIKDVLKANALARIPIDYKEIETFDTPYIGKGKVYKLENGFKLIILPKPGPTTINTFVKVGGLNEQDRIRGISHLIEHFINGNIRNQYSSNSFKTIKEMGAENNAFTSIVSTNYYINAPINNKEELEDYISVMSDAILHADFHSEDIEKTKRIIVAEKNIDNSPLENQLNYVLIKNLLNLDFDINSGQNSRFIIGSEQTLKNTNIEEIRNFYNTWYKPDNMVSVVVGNIDSANTVKLFAKYFNKKESNSISLPKEKPYLPLNHPIQKTKRIDIRSHNQKYGADLKMGFIGPKYNDIKDSITASLLMDILQNGKYSRFEKALKSEKGFARINQDAIGIDPNSPTMIKLSAYIFSDKKEDKEKVLKAIYSIIYDLTRNPVTEKELEIAKSQYKNLVSKRNESSLTLSDYIGDSLIYNGSIKAYSNELKIIDSITANDIQTFAKKYLDLNKAAIVMIHPYQTINSFLNEKAPLKTNTSKETNTPKFNTGHIKEYNLPNNLRLIIDSSPEVTRTAIDFEIEAKTIPQAKPGVSEILNGMLKKSTKHYKDNEQLNEFMYLNNLEGNIFTGRRSINAYLLCEADKTLIATDFIKEMVLYPDLRREKFEQNKKDLKSSLEINSDNYYDSIDEELYGKNNPYHISNRKKLENIDNITYEEVINFYNQILANSQGRIVLNIPSSKLKEFQNDIFKSLNTGIPVFQKYEYINMWDSTFSPLSKTKIFTKIINDNQAYINQTFKTIENRNVKDEVTASLLNIILAGYSNSKLFKDLRENQGLTYNVSSNYKSYVQTGTIDLMTEITMKDPDNNKISYENIQKSLDSFNKNINDLINKPVTYRELNAAKLTLKNNLTGAFESSIFRNNVLIIGNDSSYGINYTDEKLKIIDSITPEDIQKAAKLFLDKPSIISVKANKEALEANKSYLSSIGEVKEF